MKRDQYMGIDVHAATSVVCVLNAEGREVLETIVKTEEAALIRLVQSLAGPVHITFEETTQADWLAQVLRAYAAEVIVCDPRRNKLLSEGSKGDKTDARKLAELIRVGLVRPVYHGHDGSRKLKELVRGYETLSIDTIRTMVRIKAIYRGRGITTKGRAVYQPSQREKWLEQLSGPGVRQRVCWYYEQLDHLQPLRRRAKLEMLAESRKHRAVGLLRSIPQFGPIRSALVVATVDTPFRFRTRRQLWSYSGLAVVTHMSSEYEIKDGRVVRSRKPIATRGLNRNANRRLKEVFTSAASGGAQTEPYRTYLQGLEKRGISAEMARLTLARKLAAIALRIWKKGETFDPKKLKWTT